MASKQRVRSLSRRSDSEKLGREGIRLHVNSWLLINMLQTQTSGVRVGWTIARQVGSAVVRNRLRRWGREYLRKWFAHKDVDLDLNLIFKRQEKSFYKALSHEELDETFEKMVGKIERHLK